MTKKKKLDFGWVKKSIPYLLVAILVIAIAAAGSNAKQQSEVSAALDTFDDSGFRSTNSQSSIS